MEDGQVFFLDFDGAMDVSYHGPVTVNGLDIPEFSAATSGLAGREAGIISHVVSALRDQFSESGVSFTTERPADRSVFSTIYVGGADHRFAEYGSFFGLAEQVDIGNQIRDDNAFVFSESIAAAIRGTSADSYQAALVDVIGHEIGHLLGEHHSQPTDSRDLDIGWLRFGVFTPRQGGA